MLVTSRRSLILGLTSLVASPMIVKASSLMPLRGYELDPKVIGLLLPPDSIGAGRLIRSGYNYVSNHFSLSYSKNSISELLPSKWSELKIEQKTAYLNSFFGVKRWAVVRESELDIAPSWDRLVQRLNIL